MTRIVKDVKNCIRGHESELFEKEHVYNERIFYFAGYTDVVKGLVRIGLLSPDQNPALHPQVIKPTLVTVHRRKIGQIPAAFWPLFKNVTFEFSKHESLVVFIMPKHSSDGNFRPLCAFIDFLQMFKVGKFAS